MVHQCYTSQYISAIIWCGIIILYKKQCIVHVNLPSIPAQHGIYPPPPTPSSHFWLWRWATDWILDIEICMVHTTQPSSWPVPQLYTIFSMYLIFTSSLLPWPDNTHLKLYISTMHVQTKAHLYSPFPCLTVVETQLPGRTGRGERILTTNSSPFLPSLPPHPLIIGGQEY